MAEIRRSPYQANFPKDAGPYRATVIKHLDGGYMGRLRVSLRKTTEAGDPLGNEEAAYDVAYLSPFYGTTGGKQYLSKNKDYNSTQKAYGFWMVPPDVGTDVLVIFTEGVKKEGFWIGCIQSEYINMTVPGVAPATDTRWKENEPGDITGKRLPSGEINTLLEDNKPNSDPTKIKRPYHPHQTAFLKEQGLLDDWVRGTTTSSARRDMPSMVFGISTPGPIDKSDGAPKGRYGTNTDAVLKPVSRLGGTSFVMDDGDETLVRKAPASEAPPEYDVKSDYNLPHNELVRIRTRTGHQILLHNTEDLIYIGNARGTTWVELTSNGKIDIYAKDSISMHTENDLNFTAGRDINLKAGGNVNTNAGASILETSAGTNETKAGGNIVETAPNIHMNGPEATEAPQPHRVPQHEPWSGHENLNPAGHTPDKTQGTTTPKPEEGQLPTIPDTFRKGV